MQYSTVQYVDLQDSFEELFFNLLLLFQTAIIYSSRLSSSAQDCHSIFLSYLVPYFVPLFLFLFLRIFLSLSPSFSFSISNPTLNADLKGRK